MLVEMSEYIIGVRIAAEPVTSKALSMQVVAVELVDDGPHQVVGLSGDVENAPVILVMHGQLKSVLLVGVRLVRHGCPPES
jgi:hypothetical protein